MLLTHISILESHSKDSLYTDLRRAAASTTRFLLSHISYTISNKLSKMCKSFTTDRAGNVSTSNATYVEPSATRLLQQGEKLKDIFYLNIETPYFVQKLANRTYFFGGGFYTTTFYIGNEGVLLFDPVENQGQHLIKAIKEITPLPIKAILYSHTHADHIISTRDILDTIKTDVRIIASSATAEKMEDVKCSLPRPTETVAWPSGTVKFEDLTVELHGFVRAAHCDDSAAWLLKEEKILHHPDLINGDQPPFYRFATAENYLYFRRNVEQLGSLPWNFATLGHGNVGSKSDVSYSLQYLDDIEKAVQKGMAMVQFGVVGDMTKYTNHATLMVTFQNEIKKVALEAMKEKYGKTYGFETSVPGNIEMVLLSSISYR